jgi:mxaJ protein
MSSAFRRTVVLAGIAVFIVSAAGVGRVPRSGPAALRVCADPNNLPFSNDRLEGFENRVAALIAADLGVPLEYTWWAQRRGFLRSTLNAGLCDVVIGLPTSVELALTTRPYYRSTYVFVTRRDRRLRLHSIDDEALRQLRIGVPLVGDDGANAPPAHALSRRGIIRNVVGYSVYGDYRSESPPARIIDAVASGEIDVATAWGPLAGYFAGRQKVALELTPIEPQIDVPFLPFVFDISAAVRRDSDGLRARLEEVLLRRRAEIDAILAAFNVPRVDRPGARG